MRGEQARQSWRRRGPLWIAVLIGLLAAVLASYRIGVFPPSLEGRSSDLATSSAQVLIDTPRSTIIDLRQQTYDIETLADRALLIGNLVGSPGIRDYVAEQTGIDSAEIKVTAPLTPEQPQAVAGTESEPHTSDILEAPDDYRLNVQVNPTVPILEIYAAAPDAEAAAAISTAAVQGLGDYLDSVAEEQGTPSADRVNLVQLGQARSGVINEGAGSILVLLAFLAGFALSLAASLLVARIRRATRDGIGEAPARGLS